MGWDGAVIEIRSNAERTWLFEIGDRIVAAMDEFFGADILLFENVFEEGASLFEEAAFVGDVQRQFREDRRSLREKLLDVFGLQIHVRYENDAFALLEKVVDLLDVGVDGTRVFQFETEFEHLEEIPLRFGKGACSGQLVIDVIKVDVFRGRGFPSVCFRHAAQVMEILRDVMRHFRMLRQQPCGHEAEDVHWLLDAPSDDRVEDVERKNHGCRKKAVLV